MRRDLKISIGWRRALWLTGGLLAVSGVLWLWLRDAEGSEARYRFLHWSMAAHTGAAMIFMLVIGGLWRHVTGGIAQARNRLSGLVSVGCLVVVVGSGWWLLYGPESSREWMSLVHWCLGLFMTLGLPLHAWLGRRSRRSKTTGS